jgi:hypothetical protein
MTKPDMTPREAKRQFQLLLKAGCFVAALSLFSAAIFIAPNTHEAEYLLVALFWAMVGLMWPTEA